MFIPHITIHTRCLEESIRFYQEIAGLSIQRDLREMGAPIVFLAHEAEQTCIELIADAQKPYQGEGLSIGFHTENVEKKREELDRAGLQPTPILSPNPHTKFFFVRDPNGIQIQLI